MNQSGNRIQNANLQEFLDSAANAQQMGQRQFFTPTALATALCSLLPPTHHLQHAIDLGCGDCALLDATGAPHRYGIDIDSRSARTPRGAEGATYHLYQADITQWAPLAHEASLRADLITLNPPFSLAWHTRRLACLTASHLPAVRGVARSITTPTIDSTLASLLLGLHFLALHGEGFLICNQDTATRLLERDHPRLLPHIWAWVTIPGTVYEGQHTVFDTAVLYFAASHQGERPARLTTSSADPATVTRELASLASRRSSLRTGHALRGSWSSCQDLLHSRWSAVQQEYKRLHSDTPDHAWNLWLDESGTIRRHLTPFQSCSRIIDPDTIRTLHSLHGSTPISLVVQEASRSALRAAVHGGIWRVQPALVAAVDAACADYLSARAPFYSPNPVQALGWIDEHEHLTCTDPGALPCTAGQSYRLRTIIEDTTWQGKKINLAGSPETIAYHGRELVVILHINDRTELRFHSRRDDKAPPTTQRSGVDIHHYLISDLLAHFQIPSPPDITQLQPERFAALRTHLDAIESDIAARLARSA